MATVTPINRPKGQNRAGLSIVLDYVKQEKKTEYEGLPSFLKKYFLKNTVFSLVIFSPVISLRN